MNKNIGITIGVIVIAGIVGAFYFSKNSEVMEKKPEVMVKPEIVMEKKTEMVAKEEVMIKSGSYEAYSSEKIVTASETNDVVLFFRASWCPSCQQLNADIKANLNSIPENLTILDVDYDSSAELKQKYGVTYQHTFVQVDKDGNLINKWSGGSTLASIVKQIK